MTAAGYTLGYIFALWGGTFPSDRFGRKPMILSIHLINICTVLTEMFATHWTHWLAAKILNVSP
jgi:MFS family permease